MQITLIRENEILTQILPQKVIGQFAIYGQVGNEQKKITSIEAIDEKWILKSSSEVQLIDDQQQFLKYCVLSENIFQVIIIKSNNEKAVIFVEPVTTDRTSYQKVVFPKECCIRIGREGSNDIVFSNGYTGSNHAKIMYKNGEMQLLDLESRNGTYVNGKKTSSTNLYVGDIIYIMGLKIIIGRGFLAVNNPDGRVSFNYKLFSKWIGQRIVLDNGSDDETSEDDTDEKNANIFFRSPRFKRDIKKEVINIDPPPSLSHNDDTPLMLLLGPSMTMGMASLFTGIFTINNALSSGGNIASTTPTLIMSMSMLLGTVLWPIVTKHYEKKRKIAREDERQSKYTDYLNGIREQIKKQIAYQTEIIHENNLPIDNCVNRIYMKQRNLWERSIGHDDFGTVRLGIGELPLQAVIKYPERRFTMDSDNLQENMLTLGEEPKILNNVPISLSLINDNIVGIIGPRRDTVSFSKGLIVQLLAQHSYDEMKLVFIYESKESDIWHFVRWFPHVWNNERTVRFIASDQSDGKELSAYLENILQTRPDTRDSAGNNITPHFIIFACSKNVADKMESINQILRRKEKSGFSIIALYDDLNNLPKECSKVIELGQSLPRMYDRNDISGKITSFKQDTVKFDEGLLTRKLSNIQLNTLDSSHALPSMLTFLEMYNVGRIEHLNILTRWKENDPSNTLEAPIGVDATGDIVTLDLHEKYHGPHGLVAGMTGSGKSEFIITYILSLAINYHPNEVAFILIDYKGGGMAKAFEKLPHTVGIITNLDGSAVKRSLVSIQSELKRRQAIFNAASKSINVSNIDIYKYQKLYREGSVSEALPHLFIISDEFAELKNQQPEFMYQLVSAARIGRSLGVHLILATQKPSGVVDDQIWSNSKFRVCLKVQEKSDSMDMLKRPEAAELSATGRFYLQVGYNELFSLGQSAWAGAPYIAANKPDKHKDENVSVIDNLGKVIRQAAYDNKKMHKSSTSKQLDEITNYLSILASEEKIKSRPLWLDPIPAHIYLDELKKKYDTCEQPHVLSPIIGEADDPENQDQYILRLPISEDGNAIIYGVSGSGKTTFLTTMVYSLISEHTQDEVNLYILDFGSETLRIFNRVPHVADVFLSDESEKIKNLFQMLMSEMSRRKKLFSDFGGDYRSYLADTKEKLPAMIVIIHNYSVFADSFDNEEDSLNVLTREGIKYGIYFILTAASTNAIRYRMLQNFKQLIVLQLNDTTEYSGILGSTDGVYPSPIPGRGIIKRDKVYEFQTACIARDQGVRDSVRSYNQERSEAAPVIPTRETPKQKQTIDAFYLSDSLKDCEATVLPIGLEMDTKKVAFYDYGKSYIHLVISQEPVSSSFAGGLAEIASQKDATSVILLDGDGRVGECAGCHYAYDEQSIDQAITELFSVLVERNNATKDALEKGIEPPIYSPLIVIINGLIDLNIQLSQDAASKFSVLLEKGSASYNVNFFICETSANLASFSTRTWYSKHIDFKNWIWIGKGISKRYQDNSATDQDTIDTISDGQAYVVNNHNPIVIQYINKRIEGGGKE